MNNLADLNLLTTEIKFYSQQGLMCFMEVGKRLVEARKLVPHGRWGEYIESNYEFSQRHANRLMEVYESFPNWTPESNLSYKKAYALLDVPAADRETFLSQPHEVNGQQKTVDEMTSRELAATIKALKDIEKAKADSDKLVQDQAADITKLKKDLDDAKVAQKMLADLKKPDTVTVEKRIEVIPPDYEKLKFKLDTLENENKLLKLQADTRTHEDERDDYLAKASTFTARIRNFIRDMAAIGYLGGNFSRLSPQGQKDYEAAITSLEKLCQDMRDQLIIPKNEQVYEMEVGQ